MAVIKKTEAERRYALLKGNIKKRMEANQVTNKQMAYYTGMHPGTFADKTNHPERFTYPELMIVVDKLHFTEAEVLEAII